MVPRMRLSCMFCTMFPVRRSEDRGHSENSDSDSFLHFFCRRFTQINTDYFKRLKTVSRKGAKALMLKVAWGLCAPQRGHATLRLPGKRSL